MNMATPRPMMNCGMAISSTVACVVNPARMNDANAKARNAQGAKIRGSMLRNARETERASNRGNTPMGAAAMPAQMAE